MSPQCNKPAKRGHIIFLYARKLKALDNAEEVRLKRCLNESLLLLLLFYFDIFVLMVLIVCSRLELEQGSRRIEQLEVAQCRQQMQLMVDENIRLRKEVEVCVFFRTNSLLYLMCLGTSYLEQGLSSILMPRTPKYFCKRLPFLNIKAILYFNILNKFILCNEAWYYKDSIMFAKFNWLLY